MKVKELVKLLYNHNANSEVVFFDFDTERELDLYARIQSNSTVILQFGSKEEEGANVKEAVYGPEPVR